MRWCRSGAGVDRLAVVVGGRFLRELSWLPANGAFNVGGCFATGFSFFLVETVCCQPYASIETQAAFFGRLEPANARGFAIRG